MDKIDIINNITNNAIWPTAINGCVMQSWALIFTSIVCLIIIGISCNRILTYKKSYDDPYLWIILITFAAPIGLILALVGTWQLLNIEWCTIQRILNMI